MRDCYCPEVPSGHAYCRWIGSLFGACAYSPVEKLAYTLGAVSLALWFVALLPQIITNFHRKSGKGVSLGFVGLSIVGGSCLLVGGILTNSPLTISILGLYIVLCNVVVAAQVLYYGRRRRVTKLNLARFSAVALSIGAPVAYLSVSGAATAASSAGARTLLEATLVDSGRCDYRPEISAMAQTMGSVLAWVAGVIFFCSRAPQIWKNYQGKEVKLSLTMMILIVLGNVTLGLQVLLICESATFWSKTFPIILASIALVVWDVVILAQAYLYRKCPRYF